MWRAEFESTIQERDSTSNAKHSETLTTAKGQLERFYAEYNDRKEKSAKKLKDAEVKTAAATKSENFWVCMSFFNVRLGKCSKPCGFNDEQQYHFLA
jgi:hypothetical protein